MGFTWTLPLSVMIQTYHPLKNWRLTITKVRKNPLGQIAVGELSRDLDTNYLGFKLRVNPM